MGDTSGCSVTRQGHVRLCDRSRPRPCSRGGGETSPEEAWASGLFRSLWENCQSLSGLQEGRAVKQLGWDCGGDQQGGACSLGA